MGYEVDFLPVGENGCSGDAIVLRHGNLSGGRNEQRVIVIDGGFADTGEKVVEHVRHFYKTDHVDLVVSTHPDNDHSRGLQTIVEELSVGALWMHRPWLHTSDIAEMFQDGRVTDTSVREGLRKSLDSVRSLERIAVRKGIPIVEPFTGVSDRFCGVDVLGPTVDYYENLLLDFRCTPEPVNQLHRLMESLKAAGSSILETWGVETLGSNGVTSAENNSSTVLLIRPTDDDALLFTGDAGIPALGASLDVLEGAGFDMNKFKFIQVPHHGSRRNVSPEILDRLLGPRLATDEHRRTAFVSVAKGGEPKHPAKRVTNAFRRRGARVFSNGAGNCILHHKDAPSRGWGLLDCVPFFAEVEEGDEAA